MLNPPIFLALLLLIVVSFLTCSGDSSLGTTAEQQASGQNNPTAPIAGAPIPGNNGAVTALTASYSSAQVNWTKGTDDNTIIPNLRYRVYYSTQLSKLTDLNSTLIQGTAGTGWLTDVNSQVITGLTPNTTYYFTVVIRDADDKIGGLSSWQQT